VSLQWQGNPYKTFSKHAMVRRKNLHFELEFLSFPAPNLPPTHASGASPNSWKTTSLLFLFSKCMIMMNQMRSHLFHYTTGLLAVSYLFIYPQAGQMS
jgi:hypothetical protein